MASPPIAPQGIIVELVAALRNLKRVITRSQVEAAISNALDLGIRLEPFGPVALRVVELLDNVTPYDAWYVAIAEL